MTSQAWDRAQVPGTCALQPLGLWVWPAQRRPHQGFFTVRPSSCRKPFCSIHLSLRNLDLQESGGQRGLAEGLTTISAHTKGHSSHRKPRTPPRHHRSRRDPHVAGWSSRKRPGNRTAESLWEFHVQGASGLPGRRSSQHRRFCPGTFAIGPLVLPGRLPPPPLTSALPEGAGEPDPLGSEPPDQALGAARDLL